MNGSGVLDSIVDLVADKRPDHARALRKYLAECPSDFIAMAENYLSTYVAFLSRLGKHLDFVVDSYLMVVEDTFREQIRFRRTGHYRFSTFDTVMAHVYSDRAYMSRYMVGLALTQFLWKNHRDIFLFFRNNISSRKGSRYLEIGPGHGLFLLEAVAKARFEEYTAVDISAASLELCKALLRNQNEALLDAVILVLGDIYVYEASGKYDFVTVGEVLEHVEHPLKLLELVHSLLNPGGTCFISTCANCPAIDHIALFASCDEIREIVADCGFAISAELQLPYQGTTLDEAIKRQLTVNYCALLRKQ